MDLPKFTEEGLRSSGHGHIDTHTPVAY